jgi:hypothetical protein
MIILSIVACLSKDPIAKEFPTILDPLESIRVGLPEGSGYPESIAMLSEDTEEYAWVHARGYLHVSLEEAWTAVRNDLVYVNQRTVDSYTVTEVDAEEYDYIFVVENEVQDIVPVAFTNEWRHAGNLNDKSEVSDVVIRWQKIEGTDFIQLMEGSVEILPVDGEGEVVEIRIIEHLKATLDQEENAVEYVTDMAERWQLVANGASIPDY